MTITATPGTEIRYLPPDRIGNPPTALGLGIAVFENRKLGKYRVFFGFAGRDIAYGEQLLAGGFALDNDTVGALVADWFDYRVMRYCAGFVLRGGDPTHPGVEANLTSQFIEIRDKYYPGVDIDC